MDSKKIFKWNHMNMSGTVEIDIENNNLSTNVLKGNDSKWQAFKENLGDNPSSQEISECVYDIMDWLHREYDCFNDGEKI